MTQGSGTLEVERRVPGSPAEAFSYFTDSDKHARWQGISAELDPRPGGAYIVRFNEHSRVRGEFLVVDAPRRLVLSWGWETDTETEYPPGAELTPACSTTVEITFVEDGDSTVVRVVHSGLPAPRAFEFTTYGWRTYLDRLEELAGGADPGADPLPGYLATL